MKYREEKKKRGATKEEEEIHDFMDTIASKTLTGELSKEVTVELLSDLMATSVLDKVNPADDLGATAEHPTLQEETEEEEEKTEEQTITEEREEVEEDTAVNIEQVIDTASLQEIQENMDKENPVEGKKLDNDFYTKSMDLTDSDIEMSEDFKEKGLPLPLKVLIALLIIALILAAIYFIYLRIK